MVALNTGFPDDTSTPVNANVVCGHELLAKERQRVSCGTVGSTKPSRGLWVCNEERRKLAGRIVMVRRTGNIVVRSYFGNVYETTSVKLEDNGYCLLQELPQGQWAVTGDTEPRVLDEQDLTRYDLAEITVPTKTTETKTKTKTAAEKTAKKAKAKKELTPCLCGCGAVCKSRFISGHDAKLKSFLRRADAVRPLKLNAEQVAYLKDTSWMTDELWSHTETRNHQ